MVLIACAAGGGIVSHYAERHPSWGQWWFASWTVACVIISAVAAAQGDWALSAWMAFCAAVNGWSWWNCRKRRKRKRATALIGAKSRARLAALVRKAREAGTPSPVRRPVPQGGAG